MVGGKSKVNTFKDLRENITNSVIGWKEKFISKAGREILVKIVAQVIPTKGGARNFCLGGPSCNSNIFSKTTPTYTYTHAFLLYTHTFLFDKFYIYTHQITTKRA